MICLLRNVTDFVFNFGHLLVSKDQGFLPRSSSNRVELKALVECGSGLEVWEILVDVLQLESREIKQRHERDVNSEEPTRLPVLPGEMSAVEGTRKDDSGSDVV